MDALYAIAPDDALFMVSGTGQTNYGLNWGNGEHALSWHACAQLGEGFMCVAYGMGKTNRNVPDLPGAALLTLLIVLQVTSLTQRPSASTACRTPTPSSRCDCSALHVLH